MLRGLIAPILTTVGRVKFFGILRFHVFGACEKLDAALHVKGMGWNVGEFHGVPIVDESRQVVRQRALVMGGSRSVRSPQDIFFV